MQLLITSKNYYRIMIKKCFTRLVILALLPVLSISVSTYSFAQEQTVAPSAQSELATKICALNEKGFIITDFKSEPIGTKMTLPFKEKYSMCITQLIDHKDPSKGTFKQRVIVGLAGFDRPSELVTEGYTANYAYSANYRDEPSRIFNTNMVFVEHRYFAKSTPFRQDDSTITDENLNWDYMNATQAAADLHNVVEAFKNIFPGKWIASGISKGGQTAMFYRAFYPNDVDITMPYVGPLCKGVEDGRHEPFIANFCGTAEDRAIIKNFQTELLKRRATIEPKLAKYAEKANLTFKIPFNEVYDYCVLEFSFAFWQWGRNPAKLPDTKTATDDQMLNVLLSISGPDYFSEGKDSSPFYVQAARELGYYGYDVKPFKGLLTIKSAKGYLHRIMLPQNQKFEFSKFLYNKVNNFLKTTDAKMLFIYGEYDPWSAVMPVPPVENEKLKKEGKGRETMHLFVDPNGSHSARIYTLPEADNKRAIEIVNKWLAE